ncbi:MULTISPECIES: TolC family protein [Chryseobacterium]|uniref:Cobalt-zinc-cadmium efflux system outer membrane protein n=1 Tax=Chryseobacterium camelliae TaxID=1265445 RepID=A0ABU0TL00_9FLAO|nr:MULTISPECIES: TolC family protein [Chryseobacterium]MDT3408433.1 cobalt-zinc-cadmium efflux system outer membrane protein [Pseudacidovorax intermedius]MDQ1097712.1 cobalt-zinc-cadmium efflux system outer membrane protein [Chryseobacterium camelliae]MDQ1101644.1 cobalt-zinc-cadmium efflux system outer membrane protein [Chryseobacterium sp. SORGH_AS_1048]MDR6085084.1 cobalt-zinc-cadmium efflux system outer membrane protein [Chryseobacterium sp. SORGH_AS_0909]MDR6129439.1 cobalt-zinc-cadmium e
MNRIAGLLLVASSLMAAQQQMSLADCEEAFQKNNLQLLAEQYNINMADADILQAKIWELPQLSGQINAYNPEGKKLFDAGHAKGAQVTQLIYMGGKKKNEIAFAKSNKELAQLQFSQLMVDLRTQLRTTYFNLYYEKLKLDNVNRQLGYMNDLLSAYRVQTAKGNVSLKDQVRLQSIVIQLNSDKVEINKNILEFEEDLKILTGITDDIDPLLSESEAKDLLAAQPFGDTEELKKVALENNADYRYYLKLIDNSKLYSQWQKSLNVPDVNIGAGWDQNGGTFKNEVNLMVGIPLPLWKSNRGNVEKANYAIQQNQKNADFQKLSLETKVQAAYQTWKNQYDQLTGIHSTDLDNLELVYTGMLKNFRSGNISLIEFTDFMDSYRDAVLQVYDMKNNVIQSAEKLNELVQTKIFY